MNNQKIISFMFLLITILCIGCGEEHTHEFVNGECECGEEHTHEFVNGECECGEEHTHEFVNGECECGEEHTHEFVNGECECGEEHTHEFVNGECECGEEHTHEFVNGECECGEEHTHEFVNGECECGEVIGIMYNITFDSEGGTVVDNIQVLEGNKIIEPSTPKKGGYIFDGWYNGTEKWNFIEGVVGEDINLTAKWIFNQELITSSAKFILVDSAVSNLQEGTNYEYNGSSYIVGDSVVGTIAEAVGKDMNDKEELIILVHSGFYLDNIEINKSNVTILGPNVDVNPVTSKSRANEAIITGVVTVCAEIDDVIIQGFRFEDKAQVIGEAALEKGNTANPSYNHENFVFKNNIVNVKFNKEVKGFMEFSELVNSYSYNTQLINNVFQFVEPTQALNMLWIDNNEDIKVLNNVFKNIPGNAFYVYDTTKGCSGTDVQIVGNTFSNVGGSGIWLRWTSSRINTDNAKYIIEENVFNNVGTTENDYAIYFGGMNNNDVFEKISISKNEFTDCTICVNVVRCHENGQSVLDGNIFYNTPKYYYVVCNNTASGAYTPTKVKVINSVFHESYTLDQFVGEVELVTE